MLNLDLSTPQALLIKSRYIKCVALSTFGKCISQYLMPLFANSGKASTRTQWFGEDRTQVSEELCE